MEAAEHQRIATVGRICACAVMSFLRAGFLCVGCGAIWRGELHFGGAASKLLFPEITKSGQVKDASGMLLVRDYVGHMASEVVKRLIEGNQIECKTPEAVTQRVRQRMMEELTVEDRLNDEVREILIQHQDEMRRTGVSYQEMYKKVKAQLARDRKLVLR